MRERELFADALDRLVEAQASLDAHDQQVQGVRQRQPDPVLPALRHPAERHPWQEVAERRRAKGEREVRAPETGSASSANATTANPSRRR